MHKVVEFIPLLLQMSLLFFFAGLVAFLHPVNTGLMIMTAALLSVISAAYIYLTVLPIFSSDSPYRTALSNVVWGIFRRVTLLLHPRPTCFLDEESIIPHQPSAIPTKTIPTMVEIMTRDAVQKSTKRDERDARAIVWTVQSLTDDNELEPFVAALPDLIWGPTRRRTAHDDMIKLLLDTRELRLVSRIEGLLRSCDTGLLPFDREVHRRISWIKALWTLAYFSVSNVSTRMSFPVFDGNFLASQLNRRTVPPVVESHLTSAYSLVRWSRFCSLSSLVQEAIYVLDNRGNTASPQDPWALLGAIQHEAHDQGYTDLGGVLATLQMDPQFFAMPPVLIERARDALTSFEDVAYDILTEYLRNCATLRAEPYEFEATYRLMMDRRASEPPNILVQTKLRDTFILIILQHWATLDSHRGLHHIDRIVDVILHVLQPSAEYFDTEFAELFIFSLVGRDIPSEAGNMALGRCNPRFIGSLLTKYLADGAALRTEDALLGIVKLSWAPQPLAYFDEETLAAVSAAPRFVCSSSAVALLKTRILTSAADLPPDHLDALLSRLQLLDSCSDDLGSVKMTERWKEALFIVLVEFLEQSTPATDDWNKRVQADTFGVLVDCLPCEQLSESLQRRFSTWFLKAINSPSLASHMHLIDAITSWQNRLFLDSLDDHLARQTLHGALTTYLSRARDGPGMSGTIIRRINQLLAVLPRPEPRTEYSVPQGTDVDTSAIREDASTQISDIAESDGTSEVLLNSGETDE
ncbi:hypothetical protein C8R44DRAFT_871418 [Mycena epipterygia]|nr:hypothetical protein C8R44DRAFT_871418 [Mycena epipterygia]